MTILGIETSCDETAVAIVTSKKEILSNVVWSHLEKQRKYGGVVPEISARAHLFRIQELVDRALNDAQLELEAIDGIAATCGPGLIGGVMVGTMVGKALASATRKPFLAINHLMGHALTPRLFADIEFPYLLLLVSGGHCQLLVANSPVEYDLLGSTLDDAVGEAFDKVGKLMGIDYPAGPQIEKLALGGDPKSFSFPRPLVSRKNSCDFSFSGLKTAVRQQVKSMDPLSDQDKENICASFQQAVADVLAIKSSLALAACKEKKIPLKAFVVAGGVAANKYISSQLKDTAEEHKIPFNVPPVQYCTDNGAMIAWAGVEMQQLGYESALDFKPRPRWPLMDLKADLEAQNSYD